MDFAPEPVLNAFTPPTTRSAPRTPVADDNGQTFDDHLDAVSNEAPERPAPAKTEAKDEAPPVDAKPDSTDDADASDEIDPDVALLGGPLPPPAPPPMAAPVVVQIAASQPQAPQTDAAPEDGENGVAPVSAPQTPAAPAMDAEANADAEAAATTAATGDKKTNAEAKPAADAPQTQPTPQTAQANTQPVQQTVPQSNVAVEELPTGVQQAIAATISAAPQATPQPTQRAAPKAATQTGETKVEPDTRDAKTDAPAANAKTRAPAANAGNAFVEAAPALQTQASNSADGSHVEQSSALATASQASTHVQHAAIDTGAQRAAPAQVGREIIRRFNGGSTNFELRLDPADLGRVEVRMEVTRDHRVTAVITADNPQALTELARNARDLEQQLQSAGLQLSDNGLSFDLRQGAQGGDGEQQNNSNARGEANASATPEQQAAPLARPIGMDRWRGVRVDLMV